MCVVGWFDTNGYILLVGGELGLPSLPVNGLPSEFGVCDTVEFEFVCDEICELINGWNCAYLGNILSIINFDMAALHVFANSLTNLFIILLNQ